MRLVCRQFLHLSLDESIQHKEAEIRALQQQEATANNSGTHETATSIGIHTWVLVAATRPGNNLCTAVAKISISLLFLFIQLMILAAMVEESSHPGCSRHAGCPSGEACVSGICQDCFDSTTLMQDSVDADGLLASDHCILTDTMPLHCDYLAEHKEGITASTVFVLMAIVMMFIPMVASDMDQNAMEVTAATYRLNDLNFNEHSRRILDFLLWCLYNLRAYVVPSASMQATCALMVTNKLTMQSILLNGFAVGFMSSIDDDFMGLLIFPDVQQRVMKELSQGYEQHIAQKGGEEFIRYDRRRWIARRTYCVLLGVISVTTIVATDFVIQHTPPGHGNPSFGTNKAFCSDVMNAIYSLIYPAIVGIATDNLLKHSAWQTIARDVVCAPLFAICAFGLPLQLVESVLHKIPMADHA